MFVSYVFNINVYVETLEPRLDLVPASKPTMVLSTSLTSTTRLTGPVTSLPGQSRIVCNYRIVTFYVFNVLEYKELC